MAKVQIIFDGKPLELPPIVLSRAMWTGALVAALNVYDQIGDPVTFLAQFGIIFNDHVLHLINVAGALLAMYFRWKAKQPLGSLQKKLTPEDWVELENQVRKKLEAESHNPTEGA